MTWHGNHLGLPESLLGGSEDVDHGKHPCLYPSASGYEGVEGSPMKSVYGQKDKPPGLHGDGT